MQTQYLIQQLELSPKSGRLTKNAPEFLPCLRSNDNVFLVVGEFAEGAFREEVPEALLDGRGSRVSVSVSVSHGEESPSGESSLTRGGLELVRFLGMRRSLEQSTSSE